MTNSKILTPEELSKIAAREPVITLDGEGLCVQRVQLSLSERDVLCSSVRQLLEKNESLRNQQWNAERVIEWMDDPERKPAIHAFTAGNERQIAYRYERILEQLK